MSDVRYQKHAGCVFTLKYHMVWCPKYRLPVLTGAVARDLHTLLQKKAEELQVSIEALEIMPDHVGLVVASDPTEAPQRLANQFKGYTSRMLREKYPHLRSRMPSLWSCSYYIGSVGQVSETAVQRFIAEQKGRS